MFGNPKYRKSGAVNCEEAQNLVWMEIDDEISADAAAALAAHRTGCADCRAMTAALATQNEKLVRAFEGPRTVAEGVADQVLAQLPGRRLQMPAWVRTVLAAAAGFLLAVVIFHPWSRQNPLVSIKDPSHATGVTPATTGSQIPSEVFTCAHLSVATGKVEIEPAGATSWRAMETAGAVPTDARVRTGPGVRCEFSLADGSTVRLNEQTELHFAATRRLELATGQVWSGVARGDAPFSVSTSAATVTALGTRFDLSLREEKTTLVCFEGSTRVKGSSGERVVHGGEELEISADGPLEQPRRLYDLSLAARWIDELLVLKGRDNPELSERIDDLLARLGDDKLHFLYDSEIRALGDHCVLPLTRYIQSDRSSGEPARRRQAAAIVADCAQPWCIPYLIELLSDRDGEVRAAAGRGLHRLTNSEMGSEDEWRTSSPAARESLVREWNRWWEQNKDKIPGAQQRPSGKTLNEPMRKV